MHRARLRGLFLRRFTHLVGRFLGSLSPRRLDPDDDAWIREHLTVAERDLWQRMSRADRKHAAGVARRVATTLPSAARPVIAAAALHDVGKIVSGYGTVRRSLVTALAAVVGRERLLRRGGRAGDYLAHASLGGDLLAAAGSDPLTVEWARQHHLGADQRTVPAPIGDALAAADDD